MDLRSKVVENSHFIPMIEQLVSELGTDKARSSRNQNFSHLALPCCPRNNGVEITPTPGFPTMGNSPRIQIDLNFIKPKGVFRFALPRSCKAVPSSCNVNTPL